MKYIPILFSTLMVQALLDNRKTMTRRIATPRKKHSLLNGEWSDSYILDPGNREWLMMDNIYGKPCDILYVRESHYRFGKWIKNGQTKTGKQKWKFVPDAGFENFLYQDQPPAVIEKPSNRGLGWYKRSSLFMPKIYTRLFLENTGIRLERLQDITPEDALDEGIEYWNVDPDAFEGGELIADYANYMWRDDEKYEDYHFPTYAGAIDSFKSLWQKINGEESWNQNPLVWAIPFKRIPKPENF